MGKLLPEEPLSVLQLGLEVPGHEFRNAAIKWMSVHWLSDKILQMFAMTAAEEELDQCHILLALSQSAALDEVLEVLSRSQDLGYWRVANAHVHVLIQKFPMWMEVLDLILHEEDRQPHPTDVLQ